jgi:hypothetical protein
MINFLKKYGWSFWLGFSLVITGNPLDNWKFWFILIPTLILAVWNSASEKIKTN